MRIRKFIFIILSLLTLGTTQVWAQPRKVQNRPYIDMRRLHWGFLFGFQLQDMELKNNGYVNPETGEQWYADVDNYNPGFSVGVLGEMKMTNNIALRLAPTLHFGQKHVLFREQVSKRDTTQNIKSTYISLPLDVKFSAPRYNNFRPYFIAGAAPTVDLTARKHHQLLVKPMDCYIEFGMGCDMYLGFFKLIPELKFSFGLLDIIKKNRKDLIDQSLMKYTDAVDGGRAKMITLTLYFE